MQKVQRVQKSPIVQKRMKCANYGNLSKMTTMIGMQEAQGIYQM